MWLSVVAKLKNILTKLIIIEAEKIRIPIILHNCQAVTDDMTMILVLFFAVFSFIEMLPQLI